jgi:hypothetical protein
MFLCHPLSNFLTLFANILQHTPGPHALSDLKLMELVISLRSEPAFHVNAPTADTAQLFVKLGNVAGKFIKRAHSNGSKPMKRGRDGYDHHQKNSLYPTAARGSHMSETFTQQNDFIVKIKLVCFFI